MSFFSEESMGIDRTASELAERERDRDSASQGGGEVLVDVAEIAIDMPGSVDGGVRVVRTLLESRGGAVGNVDDAVESAGYAVEAGGDAVEALGSVVEAGSDLADIGECAGGVLECVGEFLGGLVP